MRTVRKPVFLFVLLVLLAVTLLAGTSFSEPDPAPARPAGGGPSVRRARLPQADLDAIRREEVAAYLATLAAAAQQAAAAEQARQAAEQQALADRRKFLEAAAARERASRSAVRAPVPSGDWWPLLSQYPWDVNVAHRVMMCESHGDPNARNPRTGATGLFQILNGPTDPSANVAVAYDMFSRRGWQPWSSSRGCWG